MRHSQSSRELSTGELLLIHIQVLVQQEPRSFPTKAALLSPGYKCCQCRILLHLRCNLWHQAQVWLWRRVLLTQNANGTLNHSPWAQQLLVLHARDQNHPKSPLCPKSSPEDSSEIRKFQDPHVLLSLWRLSSFLHLSRPKLSSKNKISI